jgi:hypothetical protein
MATKATTETKAGTARKGISYSEKFGLDKSRKKLSSETNDAKGLYNPGKDFSITRIVMSESKKRYDHEDSETGEMTHGKIEIAQIDGVTAEGESFKVFSPNAPIVEACVSMLADKDLSADKDGWLSTPCIIHEVIAGEGDKNRKYLAFA